MGHLSSCGVTQPWLSAIGEDHAKSPKPREDQTLLKLLKTPPKPFTPKVKKKPSPAKDKEAKA